MVKTLLHYPHLHQLAESIAFHAQEHPGRIAVRCEERVLSYEDLHRESNRSAHALLALGLAPGDRLAYLGKESELYYELLFACAKTGLVLVPINWRLTNTEVAHILRDSHTKVLFLEEPFRSIAHVACTDLAVAPIMLCLDQVGRPGQGFADWKAAHPITDVGHTVSPDDAIAQLYTSGTTGLPKGVVLAQRSFFAVRDALSAERLDWIDWQPGDISLIGIPGFHVGGLWWAIQGFNAGITNVALRMFLSGDAIKRIRQHGITTACVVPAMLQMMISEQGTSPADFLSLRKMVYGGSPISEKLLQESLALMGCEFAQIYGLTETGNTAVCLPPAEHIPGSPRLRAAGRPYPGFAIRILDAQGTPLSGRAIGEICIRTPAHMLEYWGLPEATAATLIDDWVHTGDAGYLDDEGYVYICDRTKDTIIVAGENVYPAEIENVLCKHHAVQEAAIVGIPHEHWGETIHAFVVLTPETKATPHELMSFLKTELAGFKIPTSYEFIEVLPRNPSGKILRRVLRERFWHDRERKVN